MAYTIINLCSGSPPAGAGDLLDELKARGHRLFCLGRDDRPDACERPVKNSAFFAGPMFAHTGARNRVPAGLAFKFGLLWPLLTVFFFGQLVYYRLFRSAEAVIAWNLNEKLVATWPARRLGLKIVWIEDWRDDRSALPRPLAGLWQRLARRATIACLATELKSRLMAASLPGGKIAYLPPGARLDRFERQDTIFSSLARQDHGRAGRKFFTVGTVADLDRPHNIETIFHALAKAILAVPSLQAIIIGDGAGRKNLAWLAKKLSIDNLVWFIGGKNQARKWLDDLDAYIASAVFPALPDYLDIARAMAAGVPIIGARASGLDDLLIDQDTGLAYGPGDSDDLARQIIALAQDPFRRRQYARAGRDRALKEFGLIRCADELEKIIAL